MVIYDDAYKYIECQSTIRAQIAAIDNVIGGLLIAAAQSTPKAHITSYSTNTGQTQIKTDLRGAEAVYEAITAFRRLKNAMIAQLKGNGRVKHHVDGKNLLFRRTDY
jgi:hypothetical protein